MAISIPSGAACYFCLGEEADEEGEPLVRNCSCRGDSGFAHFSCLTQYAEQKCKQARDGDVVAFAEPWKDCNNCKQPFQGQLAIDLISAFVLFTESAYDNPNNKWDKLKIMTALRTKVTASLSNMVESESLINQLISIVNKTKKDLNMNSWVHMPKASEEYYYYQMVSANAAFGYKHLGFIILRRSNEAFHIERMKIAVTHFKKARAIFNLVGFNDDAKQMEEQISLFTNIMQINAAANKNDGKIPTGEINSIVQSNRNNYENNLKILGINSDVTMRSGLGYAQLLWRFGRSTIEAERIATKLATISRRVHGPEHSITVEADKLLKECKERRVAVLPHGDSFQALRYENDGEICVVKGPITKPRQIDDEIVHRIANNLVIPKLGCAVICHGLVSASHLNGELGEVRDMKRSGTGIRLAVHFEKKGVKSALVKPENLRIAFELPDEVV